MKSLKEALFYRRISNGDVQCVLCPRRCIIREGSVSFCRNRKNLGGKLYSLCYGNPCTINMTSPENAPLYHFIPGHKRLALAAVGCNLKCIYCQNWQISQAAAEKSETENSGYYKLSPKEAVSLALKRGAESISFTYTEPVASYEYVYDILKLAREKGIMTSIVTNGFINQEPLKQLIKEIDAINIDLKGFTEKFYRDICSGELKPVLKTLKTTRDEDVHLEIVNLIIPTLNDKPEMITQMCGWIRKNLGGDVPIHFSRFFPNYRLTGIRPTPVMMLETAVTIARDTGLKYIYIGNVPGHEANNTFCAECGKLLVRRNQFEVLENNVIKGKCGFCNKAIPGIWH
jgi:pyruvate formate lyase activating enzyme